MDENNPDRTKGSAAGASNGASNGSSKDPQGTATAGGAPASPGGATAAGAAPETISSVERAAMEMAGHGPSRQAPKPAQPAKPKDETKSAAPQTDAARPRKPKEPFNFVGQFDLDELPFASAP